MHVCIGHLKLMVYVKPWDLEVLENFFVVARYIQERETATEACVDVCIPSDLDNSMKEHPELTSKYNLTKQM